MALHKKEGHRSAGRRHKYMMNVLAASLIAITLVVVFLGYDHQSSQSIGNVTPAPSVTAKSHAIDFSSIAEQVYPDSGFILQAKWNGVAKQLANSGALNLSFVANSLRNAKEPLTSEELKVLNGTSTSNVTLNSSSALFTLYLLWSLGINNKNPIISNGPIMNYGGNPYDLASTGGYDPLGRLQLGNLSIITLNSSEQGMAEAIASSTYRPCCNNPAMFPDCNHGAAQLGLIELMVSQGRNEPQIYGALKEFNAFYYTQQYLNVAGLFNYTKNETWAEVPANEVLGYNFSSASGYNEVYGILINDNALPQTIGGSGGSCST